jgi:NAD(P)-dependent dehydrogenase (short-subunit alcohol dehydrogenase family)
MASVNNLTDKIIFMTGATSGFGKVAAWETARKGATVITTYRNEEKAAALLTDYKQQYPGGKGTIQFVHCDLNSLNSINKACLEVKKEYNRLDMILNNAGIMNMNFKESSDGIEQTFQVNLLAPSLIIHLLSDMMKDAPDPRIINTSSGLHQGVIQFDDPEFRNKFNGMKAYRQSKLGLILLGRYMSAGKTQSNIHFFSQHPGLIRTELGRDFNFFARSIFWLMGKSPKKGAETLLHLVESPMENLEPGAYYANKKVDSITPESHDLDMAEKLLLMIRDYLKSYIKESSILFDKNEKTV